MAKCDRCKYEWDSKSTHVFVSCPSCYKKVKIREISEVVEASTIDKVKEVIENE